MEPRPPSSIGVPRFPRSGGPKQHLSLVTLSNHNEATVNSSADLESRFSMPLLLHAARCVGLDYTSQVRGCAPQRLYGSLANIECSDIVPVLGDFHEDPCLLQRLHEIIATEASITEVDESLVAQHTVDRNVPEADHNAMIERLHKIYRNPIDPVPLKVIKAAEVALRRYNAHQKEMETMLLRVLHACQQLEAQQHKYESHSRPLSAPASSRRSESRDNASCASSKATEFPMRNPADAVGKLLMHLKKQAVSERNHIRREISIRNQQHQQDSSSGNSAARSPNRSMASNDNMRLVSSRRHRKEEAACCAFQHELESYHKKQHEQEVREEQQRASTAAQEHRIATTLENAERRRYEYLRNRELRARAQEERAQAIHSEAEAKRAVLKQQEEEAEQMRLNDLLHAKVKRAEEGTKQTERRRSSTRQRQDEAMKRAQFLQEAKEQKALEKEEAYRKRIVELERGHVTQAALASKRKQSVEERRRSALEKAKALEEQKKRDTEALRQLMDADQERRMKQNAYLASIKDEASKIKEEQRRRLVQQYARARDYREDAFRQQWERDLKKRVEDDRSKKAFASALHQLQLKQEAKLKGILGEQKFTEKDVAKLDQFISELENLTMTTQHDSAHVAA